MTLKEFAAQNGINYATAKTWLRRGRIQKVSDGFQMEDSGDSKAETLKPESETSVKPLAETLKPLVESSVNPESETLKPETLKPETCAECETLKREVETLRAEIEQLKAQIVSDSITAEPEIETDSQEYYDRAQVVALLQAAIRRKAGYALPSYHLQTALLSGRVRPQKNGLYSHAQVANLLDEIADAELNT